MKKNLIVLLFSTGMITFGISQSKVMTPEQLIELNRVSAVGLTNDGSQVVYKTSSFDLKTNTRSSRTFSVSVHGGDPQSLDDGGKLVRDKNLSPDGKWKLMAKEVKLQNVSGLDHYDDVPNSNVYIYNQLNYRHWDTWEDGSYSHVMLQSATDTLDSGIDLMEGEPFDCPQKPFGGDEDYIWSPDSKSVLYVTKKLAGTEYAVSTNSDIYEYNLETKQTKNLTANNRGYDTHPAFSSKGTLAWLQMERDGYESDKNDIIVRLPNGDVNLTKDWDGMVNGFIWSGDGSKIYYNAPVGGTVQAFQIDVPVGSGTKSKPKQISEGQFDVNGIIGQSGEHLIVYRRDMNHATEIYNLNIETGAMQQLSKANNEVYEDIKMSKIEKRMVKTTDGKDMVTWVIYPPDFDPTKKYPTLLYCQGGPQGALSQFYSFRWNFQLMAANGYIIVAPNRRGMPGHGVEWNEQISKDYGGQNMDDYLSAIDAIAKEPYVDTDRLGCVGASYGGYSVFYLASRHEGRFQSFISHDGIFNWRSMYGTTEELFFVNWDLGGAYWDKENAAAQKTYAEFNPINFVDKWDTPILIIQGGKDFRVPIGQGLEAFQAAQLQGIQSRLLFFPEENHWVLSAQNSLVWQREFFKWLQETVKDVKK
ncbi:alpha/beta fold hydrolase [Muricauda sp. SCSIO 64092]|uniref:S9 family peptidase n=1 Tax=Allomuricauda sp. SCSIO 64092 TaxID=2908842 RepID=UPI001FF1BF4A|nr:alpha/beta fold hydrolase [Muricauda sp. SCSIO 64092]UOY07795.1 alpha/beta fold hydrolase [Muricauda sp. SCSIO 64092]